MVAHNIKTRLPWLHFGLNERDEEELTDNAFIASQYSIIGNPRMISVPGIMKVFGIHNGRLTAHIMQTLPWSLELL